ncbi:HNH endonuclease [Nafulsella turpanensis]|uniref:HNH endonuclease n=1 Tax=Nafulsella turpanensis TaxID=1265690 RepID=UPI000347B4A4|nr:HNH endonuclease signature motif containing protein [Nafulsella turpanensis]
MSDKIRIRNHRFYSSAAWQKVRVMKLQHNPLCEECERQGILNPGNEIDHIISITIRWDLRLSWDNLQTLCKPCHSRKTMEENKEAMNPKPIDQMARKLKDLLK